MTNTSRYVAHFCWGLVFASSLNCLYLKKPELASSPVASIWLFLCGHESWPTGCRRSNATSSQAATRLLKHGQGFCTDETLRRMAPTIFTEEFSIGSVMVSLIRLTLSTVDTWLDRLEALVGGLHTILPPEVGNWNASGIERLNPAWWYRAQKHQSRFCSMGVQGFKVQMLGMQKHQHRKHQKASNNIEIYRTA